MNRLLQAMGSAAWSALAAAVAFFAIRALLIDLFPNHSGNSRMSAAIVACTAAAILAFPRGSAGRALLAFASMTAVSFCISYDALEAVLESRVDAEWPIVLLAVLFALWLAPVTAILIFRRQ